MKLGEALKERAHLQRKLGELRVRISANTTTQEGTEPSEDANALLSEAVGVHAALEKLITRINLTNARTTVGNEGKTLTELIANRDMLAGLSATYSGAAASTMEPDSGYHRYARSELALVRTVAVAELRRLADEQAARLREIDNKIQEVNWSTDLVE